MRIFRTSVLVVVLAMAGVLLAGCSSDDDSSSDTGTGDGVTVPEEEKGTPVSVKLGESSEDEQYLEVEPASVAAGLVTFEIENVGTKEHELVVLQTDTPFDGLEVNADGKAAEPGVIDELEVEEGESGSLTVTLEAGAHVLICNEKDHYAQGMRAAFTVT